MPFVMHNENNFPWLKTSFLLLSIKQTKLFLNASISSTTTTTVIIVTDAEEEFMLQINIYLLML
jgi:hypothetical protein